MNVPWARHLKRANPEPDMQWFRSTLQLDLTLTIVYRWAVLCG